MQVSIRVRRSARPDPPRNRPVSSLRVPDVKTGPANDSNPHFPCNVPTTCVSRSAVFTCSCLQQIRHVLHRPLPGKSTRTALVLAGSAQSRAQFENNQRRALHRQHQPGILQTETCSAFGFLNGAIAGFDRRQSTTITDFGLRNATGIIKCKFSCWL